MLTRAPSAVVVLIVALAAGLLPNAAQAEAPPPPPGCSARQVTRTNSADKVIADLATATSTVSVSVGAGRVVWDVDVRTSITHANNAHLDLSLTSPAGTVVVLSTDNGLARDHGYNGTRFDDSAALPITEVDFPLDAGVAHATPEGALGRLIGEDPNGTWTLSVADDTAGTTGTLTSWSLELVTLPANAPKQTQTASSDSVFDIPDNGTLSIPLPVSVQGDFLTGIEVTTKIRHTASADLDVSLISPSGREVVLTTDNGSFNDDVFYGTVWRDSATTPVTDATYANGMAQVELQPEGALSGYLGENPNGTWVLKITDDRNNDTGSIEGWTLTLDTATGAACASGVLTVNSVNPNQGPVGGGTEVTVTGSNFDPAATVLFGTLAGTSPQVMSSSASATTPPHTSGRVTVSVRNPTGDFASKVGAFNFLPTSPAPIIESLSPTTGSTTGGAALTLRARNVIAGAELRIGSAVATQFGILDENTVVAAAPASTFGTFDVVLTNPDGQSAVLPSAFTYVAPPPKITGIDPNLGSTMGDTPVTLTGSNFLEGITVTFGGERVEAVREDENTLSLTAPKHAPGVVDVVITNPDGQTLTRSKFFTYEAPLGSEERVDGAGGCGCGSTAGSSITLVLLGVLALWLLRSRMPAQVRVRVRARGQSGRRSDR